MLNISVRFPLPPLAERGLSNYLAMLEGALKKVTAERTGKPLYGDVLVGASYRSTGYGNRDDGMIMVAEFKTCIGVDHGQIYTSVEAARELLCDIATEFNGQLHRKGLERLPAEVQMGFSVWSVNPSGTVGEIRQVA